VRELQQVKDELRATEGREMTYTLKNAVLLGFALGVVLMLVALAVFTIMDRPEITPEGHIDSAVFDSTHGLKSTRIDWS
jgi:hypothetical protein